MSTITDAVKQLGGVAHSGRLRELRVPQNALESGVRTGTIERIRAGWYCLPGDTDERVQTLRIGGRLNCVSLLQKHGAWVMPDNRLHVAVNVPRSRLRTPHDRGVPLATWGGRSRIETHWRSTLLGPQEPTDLLDDAAACIANCLPRDHAIVAFDSLLNRKLLSAERLHTALAGLSDSHAWMMPLVDAGCGSGLETLVRLSLRSRNVRVRSQAHMPGIGGIDLLVGDRLVVELDSRTHHDNPTAYERDRARDLALIERGYVVVRVTYRRVMTDWPAVERALLAIVRRHEHRWQSIHRSAGLAAAGE